MPFCGMQLTLQIEFLFPRLNGCKRLPTNGRAHCDSDCACTTGQGVTSGTLHQVVCSPADGAARLRMEDVLEVVGMEPSVQHFVVVVTDADIENLVAAGRKARNRGRIENALVAFNGRFDGREQPLPIAVEESEKFLAFRGGCGALAPHAHQHLMLDCLNGAAGCLRCDLVLSVLFHVTL